MATRYRIGLTLLACMLVITLLSHSIGAQTFFYYRDELRYDLGQHLILVCWSMLAALFIGIPAGTLLSRPALVGNAERFMQIFNLGNTVPSLAVLALSLAVLGIGQGPAIVALTLASLLPITRNTYEGLQQVSPTMREAARGLGLTSRQTLLRVELPNAMPVIIGGVRTALTVNVGTAPLAFLVGADSLGTLIIPAIYLDEPKLLLLGATATAGLALVLDTLLAGAGRLYFAKRGMNP